jgi:hypothetical protein
MRQLPPAASDLVTRADLEAGLAGVRADMAGLRSELKVDMAELRADVRTELAQVRGEMSELRVDVVQIVNRQLNRAFYAIVGLMATFSGLVIGLARTH